MCRQCGKPASGPTELGWVVDATPRGTVYTCPDCARQHLRAIEAKLDQEWW